MIVLRLAVFFMAMVTFAGSLVLAVLTMPLGLNNAMGIIGAVAVGTAVAVPVAWVVANKMSAGMNS
ncbi:hypothetical protein [Magnetovibrio sp.]|uniref:hypothetical protein n=1 Tax=Magnetovibrio sp. TaxID=2024836 RepID=UPI002F9374E9